MPKRKIMFVGDVAERSCEKPRTLKIARFYVQNERAGKKCEDAVSVALSQQFADPLRKKCFESFASRQG